MFFNIKNIFKYGVLAVLVCLIKRGCCRSCIFLIYSRGKTLWHIF